MTWKSMIIPSCCKSCMKSTDDYCPLPEFQTQVYTKRISSRISLSDVMSNPISPISIHDLSSTLAGSELYVFSFAELRVITRDFSVTNLIGEGGFGPVYKGFIDNKLNHWMEEAQPVAVKLLDSHDGLQGHEEWLAEIVFLGQLRHPNLVKLIGYCWEEESRLLVYEYMARGSLENQLFTRYSTVLPWSTRMKIALDAAKGLEFLHQADPPVIYRDFKPSNILLNSDYTAKLSDFGLAKDGPDHDDQDTKETTRIMGTQGYAAPEYINTGQLSIKMDVYSFGVVLLELITGKRWMKIRVGEYCWRRLVKDPKKVWRVVDPRLEGQFSVKGAQNAAALAYKCLSSDPKRRPCMSEAVSVLETLQGFEDLFFGTFVYMVPNGYYGEDCGPDRDRKKISDDETKLKIINFCQKEILHNQLKQ